MWSDAIKPSESSVYQHHHHNHHLLLHHHHYYHRRRHNQQQQKQQQHAYHYQNVFFSPVWRHLLSRTDLRALNWSTKCEWCGRRTSVALSKYNSSILLGRLKNNSVRTAQSASRDSIPRLVQ